MLVYNNTYFALKNAILMKIIVLFRWSLKHQLVILHNTNGRSVVFYWDNRINA